ncbi:hypothetical protein [Methylobacterium dankookense]|uniref:Uncharacterized protein n=1 Tax=Methylobacterium dankookense TaxID=560405 RepID=A0A564FWA9_9HYPH|nr:hypothetical protein [Methylobacterium dankookense]GJD58065.1 hypothetical protein IFDJLNFL_3980 [Methylobacterium dankookense]VUF12154.1 hypothetical protein MTDSW087_01842 [Methylobacterium dankookense]
MTEDQPEPLDEMTRLQAKFAAMEIVVGVLIGRLSEENPEIREDVKRDVSVILADMAGGSESEELVVAEVRRAAALLTSVSVS